MNPHVLGVYETFTADFSVASVKPRTCFPIIGYGRKCGIVSSCMTDRERVIGACQIPIPPREDVLELDMVPSVQGASNRSSSGLMELQRPY